MEKRLLFPDKPTDYFELWNSDGLFHQSSDFGAAQSTYAFYKKTMLDLQFVRCTTTRNVEEPDGYPQS